MFDVNNLASIKISLASPQQICEWSHGEVTKPETINYQSQKPEMDGLFCERIFGPINDYECHCGKYKKIRYAGVICDKCGVEVISKEVRRERMGHIELATPCSHILYLKNSPSIISLILDIPEKELEEVIYFTAHICMYCGHIKTIYYKEYIDDHSGREVFITTIKEIQETLEPDSLDFGRSNDILAHLQNPTEPFDFFGCADFITEKTGATFGEGAEAVKKLLQEVDLQKEFDLVSSQIKDAKGQNLSKLTKRLEVFDAFIKSGNKPEWMILDALPVIPPDLRPMLQLDGGRFAASDLNDLYRRVISRNNRLKKLIDMNAPYVILMNEKRMVQEAVDALIDNGARNGKPVTGPGYRPLKSLSGGLKGKEGRFRENLLGKRVDYSGRSVIAIGPSLKMYQCGIPREMAITLLRPFIANILVKEGKCTLHRQADKKIDDRDGDVYDVVEKIISYHPVLLNRQPTLHRLGIQAFQPVLVDGKAIRLNPLVCAGFNADFDGDQMAIYLPISKAAQEEALNIMIANKNILSPKDGKVIFNLSKDILIGNYYLTIEETATDFAETAKQYNDIGEDDISLLYNSFSKMEGKVFKDPNEALKAYDLKKLNLHSRIAIPSTTLHKTFFSNKSNFCYVITTVGKLIFNSVFPNDFPYINDFDFDEFSDYKNDYIVKKGTDIPNYIKNKKINNPLKKQNLQTLINVVFKLYGQLKTSVVLDKLKDNGFRFSTQSGLSIGIEDFPVLENKKEDLEQNNNKNAEIINYCNKGILSKQEGICQISNNWSECASRINANIFRKLNKNNLLYILNDCESNSNRINYEKLIGMPLLSNRIKYTNEIPYLSSFREGLPSNEYYKMSINNRLNGSSVLKCSSDAGYLTRKLVYASQKSIIREDDCHTDHGSVISDIRDKNGIVIVSLYSRLIGRFACHNVINPKNRKIICRRNSLIDENIAKAIINAGITHVEIRSLFGCESKYGICSKCYGINLATGEVAKVGDAVGVIASQSISEPIFQRAITGPKIPNFDYNKFNDFFKTVIDIFEPKTRDDDSILSEISGTITNINKINDAIIIEIHNNYNSKRYVLNNNLKPIIKKGDKVNVGTQITTGSVNLKTMLSLTNIKFTENYMIKKLIILFAEQHIYINDKHLEAIIKWMFNMLLVINKGDTNLSKNEKVDITSFSIENETALTENLKPAIAIPILLTIKQVGLYEEGFLSAASYQYTNKILANAVIHGKTDILWDLNSCAISGKLLPNGTGLRSSSQEKRAISCFNVIKAITDIKKQYVNLLESKNLEKEDEENAGYLDSESKTIEN